jgi:hypothetical protein
MHSYKYLMMKYYILTHYSLLLYCSTVFVTLFIYFDVDFYCSTCSLFISLFVSLTFGFYSFARYYLYRVCVYVCVNRIYYYILPSHTCPFVHLFYPILYFIEWSIDLFVLCWLIVIAITSHSTFTSITYSIPLTVATLIIYFYLLLFYIAIITLAYLLRSLIVVTSPDYTLARTPPLLLHLTPCRTKLSPPLLKLWPQQPS